MGEHPVRIGFIEKGIPPPISRKKAWKQLLFPVGSLEIGDSFLVERTELEDNYFYNRVTSKIRQEATRIGIKIVIASASCYPGKSKSCWNVNGIRVWRTQ